MAASSQKKCVSVTFPHDEDITQTYYLRDKKGNLNSASVKHNGSSRSSKRIKNNADEEIEPNSEVCQLLAEELPEEFKGTTNNLSDGLLEDQEISQWGFQTPKKKKAMQSKAQESASKYNCTPNKMATPSKQRTPEMKELQDQTSARKPRLSISFGGRMGATPSKGNILDGTPKKSALKSSRRNEDTGVSTPSSRQIEVHGQNTPRRNRRMSTDDNFGPQTPSTKAQSMATIKEKPETVPQTPYGTRQRVKRSIEKSLKNELYDSGTDSDASESDFSSDEEEEYKPNGDSQSSEEESDESNLSDEKSDEENSQQTLNCRKTMLVEKDSLPVTPSRTKRKEMTFEVSTDLYFERFGSKDITSNNTLSRLKTPRLREDLLRDLLSDLDIGHKQPLAKLTNEHRFLFDRWLFTLQEGYSVILYGLGSKKHLLQNFHDEVLPTSQVLVINGFFPGLTIKEIIDTILTDLLGLGDIPANPQEGVEIIEKIQSSRRADPLYLLIHNLDGPSLRNNKAQTIVSRLARVPRVHLIATVDHINAPLMWDQAKLHRYNFAWWDATTFMPYTVETSFESSLLIQQSGALQLSSLHSVFKSLTPNAKKIYLMIAKYQLENGGDSAYNGIQFNSLYWSARLAFLVSTPTALRSQLTEFLDHHMLKQKRGHDGSETLVIPIDNTILQQFVQSQEEKE